MFYRDPHTIAPVDQKDEMLLAIYDRLGELLDAVKPPTVELKIDSPTLEVAEPPRKAPAKRKPRKKAP